MNSYSLSRLSDSDLLRDLATLVARDRATLAEVLAHIAEVDARKLYLPAAHPSMYSYCVQELGFSEHAAYKRIQVARAARQCPALFSFLASGRLSLSGAVLLAPHLTPNNVEELLGAAGGKRKSEIEALLASRFTHRELPMGEAPPVVGSIPLPQLAPGRVELDPDPVEMQVSTAQLAPDPVDLRSPEAPALASPPIPAATPAPAPARIALRLMVREHTYAKLQQARLLLGHQVPSGDLAHVLDCALDALIHRLEKRKAAAASRPRRESRRSSAGSRHIPVEVRRRVWERDQGQCTFVSEAGRRCPACTRLEFDHIDPVARGGSATVDNLRLRCRAHNQYAAERAFGTGFMSRKRQESQRAAAVKRATRAHASRALETAVQLAPEPVRRLIASAELDPDPVEMQPGAAQLAPGRVRTHAPDAAEAADLDVIPWLRQLGFRAEEAKRAALHCEAIPDASLEERVRCALSCLAPPHRRIGSNGTAT
jgi:5-methylcytosine-specific restriction endonuclease McrA